MCIKDNITALIVQNKEDDDKREVQLWIFKNSEKPKIIKLFELYGNIRFKPQSVILIFDLKHQIVILDFKHQPVIFDLKPQTVIYI